MERIDETGFGDIRVIQRDGIGYGVDAVLLAAFAAGETGSSGIERDARVADLGTGSGVVSFILRHKKGALRITGYDVSSDAVDRAKRACALNGMEDSVDFICADVCEIEGDASFDAVVSNPPYFRRTPDEPAAAEPDERYIARHETTAGIIDFSLCAASMLRRGGSFYLVHRPDRLADIISAMRAAGIEPKELQPVAPRRGKAANIVLIRGVKGAGAELRMLPEIAVHTEDGGYTEDILSYYERASSFSPALLEQNGASPI